MKLKLSGHLYSMAKPQKHFNLESIISSIFLSGKLVHNINGIQFSDL